MLSEYIFSDGISQFILLMFVVMIAIGLGVFYFLFKQLTKPKLGKVEELEEEYDGIHEKNHPTPWGMHVVMVCTIIFSFWYVGFAFPLFHFDQKVQYEEEIAQHQKLFTEQWRNIDEETKIRMGESVFNTQCVICHGINGEGQNGKAANLVQFGNEEHIISVIKKGSQGLNKLTPAMPPQFDTLGATDDEREAAALKVASYVVTLGGRQPKDASLVEAGRQIFLQTCFACHGESGKGMGPGDAIPNFSADLTMYGNPEYIADIVLNGKNGLIGSMPAFKKTGVLTQIQLEAVASYVAKSMN